MWPRCNTQHQVQLHMHVLYLAQQLSNALLLRFRAIHSRQVQNFIISKVAPTLGCCKVFPLHKILPHALHDSAMWHIKCRAMHTGRSPEYLKCAHFSVNSESRHRASSFACAVLQSDHISTSRGVSALLPSPCVSRIDLHHIQLAIHGPWQNCTTMAFFPPAQFWL